MRVALAVCTMMVVVVFSGCGLSKRGTAVTGEFEGRDCGLYAVGRDWLVYSWSPPNRLSSPVHLVTRRLSTGAETELEANWKGGGLDIDGSTLVYTRRPQGSQTTELIAYDLESQRSTIIAEGPTMSSPVVSGGMVAWATQDEAGVRVIATTFTSGGFVSTIQDSGRPSNASDIRPRLSGSNLVFLRRVSMMENYTLMHHDMVSGITTALPVELLNLVEFDISGNWVIYSAPWEEAIHGYNLVEKVEKRLADAPRLREGPVIRNDKIAWMSHIPKEEFEPIGGRPLIGEQDFRNLHVVDIGSGRVKTLTKNQFMLRRPEFSADGKVYSMLPRAMTTSPDQIADVMRY